MDIHLSNLFQEGESGEEKFFLFQSNFWVFRFCQFKFHSPIRQSLLKEFLQKRYSYFLFICWLFIFVIYLWLMDDIIFHFRIGTQFIILFIFRLNQFTAINLVNWISFKFRFDISGSCSFFTWPSKFVDCTLN